MTASVRELKNRLSEYLRRVQHGHLVVVTDRGRPVAEIHPVQARRLTAAQRLQRMAEAGDVSLPRGRGLQDIEPMRGRGRPVADTLIEDRA